MKKSLIAILCTTALCVAPVMGGCFGSSSNQLATPVVTVNENGVASWEKVENADGYVYQIDDGEERQTAKLSVQLEDGQSIKVKALGDGETYTDSAYSASVTYTYVYVPVIGLPTPEEGRYIKEADIIQESDTVRYLVYTTNGEVAEEDNVIAVRKGELGEDGWVYGEEKIAVSGSEDGWDMFIGSASIVKGEFAYGGESYSYLIAYSATTRDDGMSNSIGLAVAKEADGEWTKVGSAPVVEYKSEIYGVGMAGCYAPSLINVNKQSGVRMFYTYADAYGHFAYFWDADLSNLDAIHGISAQAPNNGNLSGGDGETMIPGGDFCYDAENGDIYMVKDYSPAASTIPQYADRIEIASIAEEEIFTTDILNGWSSIALYDTIDLELEDLGFARAYGACIVSDAYGHILSNEALEVVYTTCAEGGEYLCSQQLLTLSVSLVD